MLKDFQRRTSLTFYPAGSRLPSVALLLLFFFSSPPFSLSWLVSFPSSLPDAAALRQGEPRDANPEANDFFFLSPLNKFLSLHTKMAA